MNIGAWSWLVSVVVALAALYVTTASRTVWGKRTLPGQLVAGLLGASAAFLVFVPSLPGQVIVLGLLQLWLVICAGRLIAGRLDGEFLRHSTRHAVLLTIVFGGLVLLAGVVTAWLVPLLLGVSLLLAWLFAAQAIWYLKHYRLRGLQPLPVLKQLPTVTVAIPARNETHALSECLSAVLASDYPKLEVLVLDDCSQDATSEVIRRFAHAGVRFIQGEQPSEGWLGKNNAMRLLAQQASGDYVIFVDVDTRLQPQTVGAMVAYALSHKLDMISVLAQRRESLHWGTVLWQLKYYWQVVLPVTNHRVPVASQCWLIARQQLQQLGGFEAVRQKIIPEGYFARQLFARDAYRFLVSDAALGVTTAKRWTSQIDTAIRLLYPLCKRQPLLVLAAVAAVGVILFPAGYVMAALVGEWNGFAWLALAAGSLYGIGYGLVVVRTAPRTWLLTWLFFGPSLIQESVLLVVSMLKYEFDQVDWKGRNVCYPVLQGGTQSNGIQELQYGRGHRTRSRRQRFRGGARA